jgi:NAD(P)-dependent dehydrogenase (short-subunit alcohol dehydrogenase family)
VVIVTGAARGLGRAIATTYRDQGVRVVGCDRLETVHMLSLDNHPNIVTELADVGNVSDVERVVAATVDRFGRIDVLVNNAGVAIASSPDDAVEDTITKFDETISTNVRGPLLFQRAVTPVMIRQGAGHIVNIASDHIHTCGWPQPVPHDATIAECSWHGLAPRQPCVGNLDLYDASKFALISFAINWGRHLQPHGIQVNNLCTGTFDSPSLREHYRELGIPMPRRAKTWLEFSDVIRILTELLQEAPGRTCDNVGHLPADPPGKIPAPATGAGTRPCANRPRAKAADGHASPVLAGPVRGPVHWG